MKSDLNGLRKGNLPHAGDHLIPQRRGTARTHSHEKTHPGFQDLDMAKEAEIWCAG